MRRFRSYKKKIACLEGEWSGWTGRSSVLPLLSALEQWSRTGQLYTHHTCNTREELRHHAWRLASHRSYELVYLAFHGSPGCIYIGRQRKGEDDDTVDGDSLTLSELADDLGRSVEGRVVHFASCSTLRCAPRRIDDFLAKTGAAIVTGFKKNVYWTQSAGFELLFFDLWQAYKDVHAFERELRKTYGGIADRLGFEWIVNGMI